MNVFIEIFHRSHIVQQFQRSVMYADVLQFIHCAELFDLLAAPEHFLCMNISIRFGHLDYVYFCMDCNRYSCLFPSRSNVIYFVVCSACNAPRINKQNICSLTHTTPVDWCAVNWLLATTTQKYIPMIVSFGVFD